MWVTTLMKAKIMKSSIKNYYLNFLSYIFSYICKMEEEIDYKCYCISDLKYVFPHRFVLPKWDWDTTIVNALLKIYFISLSCSFRLIFNSIPFFSSSYLKRDLVKAYLIFFIIFLLLFIRCFDDQLTRSCCYYNYCCYHNFNMKLWTNKDKLQKCFSLNLKQIFYFLKIIK